MRYCCLAGTDAALLLLAGAARSGEAFLFAGLRVPSTPRQQQQQQQQHDPSSSSNTQQQQAASSRLLLLPTTSRPPSTASTLRVTPADDAAGQQILEYPSMADGQDGGAPEGREEGAAQPPPIPKDTTRRGVALDGTALAFRPPTTEDFHKLGMGDWVAQKGLAVALVALDATEQAAGEPVIGAPLAGAVVEAMGGGMVGGSSVATRVCLLRHRREDGVAEAVEHALLDETINRFLNDGARISQLRVEVDDSPQSVDFYTRHGFIRSVETASEGHVLLVGDRVAALEAIQASLTGGDGDDQGTVGAVVMNLMARLLHDAGNLQGAVDAYLKALEAREGTYLILSYLILDPTRSEVFRGLGGAYQSQGQHQMAFASYQQAINLAPWDLLAYLKLGMLYEDLAVGKYEEAGDHAIRCFQYYLQHSGSEDTDVLTRLGNLQVMRLDPASAVETYRRALAVDQSLSNVWFNLANAYLKLGEEGEAARCLNEKLRLDPDPNAGVSARYLLASLEADPGRLTENDQVWQQ
ncbi:unnamed protein product [Ectocarpus fasciculatus]